DRLRGERLRDVVGAGDRTRVRRGDGEAHRAAGGLRQLHREVRDLGAGVAFADGDVGDGQHRPVVVDDEADRGAVAEYRAAHRAEGDVEALFGLDAGVARHLDGDGLAGRARGDRLAALPERDV